MSKPTILEQIVERKWQEIKKAQSVLSFMDLESQAKEAPVVRPFVNRLDQQAQHQKAAIIAEIKKASPSKGVIREDFDPAAIAVSYERNGASCLSVLTDQDYFQGHVDYLKAARAACALPVLRKDFMVDPYQIVEARAMGADCILLIAACLSDSQMQELHSLAQEWQMDALVEVHDHQEMERALRLGAQFIGVNNRNLHSFEVDLNTTIELMSLTKGTGVELVTESGIRTLEDVNHMIERGIYRFLVGEAFMREPDPGVALKNLFQDYL